VRDKTTRTQIKTKSGRRDLVVVKGRLPVRVEASIPEPVVVERDTFQHIGALAADVERRLRRNKFPREFWDIQGSA